MRRTRSEDFLPVARVSGDEVNDCKARLARTVDFNWRALDADDELPVLPSSLSKARVELCELDCTRKLDVADLVTLEVARGVGTAESDSESTCVKKSSSSLCSFVLCDELSRQDR